MAFTGVVVVVVPAVDLPLPACFLVLVDVLVLVGVVPFTLVFVGVVSVTVGVVNVDVIGVVAVGVDEGVVAVVVGTSVVVG